MATSRDGIRYTQIGQPVRAAPLPRVRLSVHAGAGQPVLVACAVIMLQHDLTRSSHKIFSQDLLTIEARCHQKPWCNVTYEDGSREEIRRRERPQWVLGPDGLPTHLMTGVLPAADSHKGQVWTMAAPLL